MAEQEQELVYVGLNGRVAALDRDTGETVWEWRASKGSTYVALLVDDDRLVVSVDGYTYALDAYSGEQLWFNPLTGYGTGPAAIATPREHTPDSNVANAAAKIRAQQRSNS